MLMVGIGVSFMTLLCITVQMRKGEPMRLIDADALIEEYDRVHVGPPGGARKLMEDAPTIEPERKKAKWIATTSLQEGQITWRDYKCSNCSHHREKPMNFCEVCGAKMER